MVEREVQELRARVAALERAVAFLGAHLGVADAMTAAQRDTDRGLAPDVVALLRAGDLLGAIARQRSLTGSSLADAKAAVERWRAANG